MLAHLHGISIFVIPGQGMTSEQTNCPCFACHPEQSSAFYASLTATRTATRTTIVHEQGTLSYMKTICDGEQDPNCAEKCDCITCQVFFGSEEYLGNR